MEVPQPMQIEARPNPFATRFIKAGSLPFVFPDGESLPQIEHRLREANWRGQIVGPHGSGKSTLLKSLEPHWATWGRRSFSFALKDGSRTLPKILTSSDWKHVDTVIVDGYEQLSLWSRIGLLLRCWRSRKGLIVTTHDRVRGIPLLFTTQTNEQLATHLTRTLLDRSNVPNSTELLERVPFYLRKHDGNMREMFLSLYDEVAQ